MLQCGPYIKDICQTINTHLINDEVASGDQSPSQSPEKKKDSMVQINDVKSFEVKLLEPKGENNPLCILSDSFVNAKPDLYKAVRKIRPDSPDVIRAAKRVEQARLKRTCNCDQILEITEENSPELCETSSGAGKRING